MKIYLIAIAALFMLLPLVLAEDLSEVARQRDEQIARESQSLKNTDAQIAEFEADLANEEKSEVDLHATETKLLTDGKQLSLDAHSMMALDKAYGVEVKQQIAECPESTKDAALAKHCREWQAKLDKDQKDIKNVRKDWMERKDKFLSARTKLDQDMAANKKAIDHFRYSIPNMKVQRDRILKDLWQINGEVKKCREAIQGSSEEHMHAVCGQMWDGNKMYPDYSPEPGDGKQR
jgi:hypothetical protein